MGPETGSGDGRGFSENFRAFWGDEGEEALHEDNDALVRNALLVAGAMGIVIGGFVGWWAARNAVRPLGQALALASGYTVILRPR